MSARTTHHCNECGAALTPEQASLYAGIHIGAAHQASEGTHDWHSCSAACAAKHLRDLADKIEAHAEKHAAAKAAVEENRRRFAAATAPGAPPAPAIHAGVTAKP